MFVEDTDLIEVIIHYRKSGHHYLAYTASEFKEKDFDEEQKASYKEVKLQMVELSWGLHNQLQEDAMVDTTGNGDRQFNFKIYKESRLKQLTKEWDAKDNEGKPIPINNKTLYRLSPAVGEAILRAYDELSFLTEDEEKNS